MKVLKSLLYWLAVLVVSAALVVLLILFFESRDQAGIDGDSRVPAPHAAASAA